MNRRDFIKTTSLGLAGSLAVPYILPSGRLFAASGDRIANHVVFCLFAGGIRNIESIEQAEGNLMPNLLAGNTPISADIVAGLDPIPTPLSTPLQQLGTLYKNFKFKQGPTGHYNGHATAMTGRYVEGDLSIKEPPSFPTVFEYYRKHVSPNPSAKGAWWISNALGAYLGLNFSKYPGYGANYGANYIQPYSLISEAGFKTLANPKTFNSTQTEQIDDIRYLLDNTFRSAQLSNSSSIENTLLERAEIQLFIKELLLEYQAGQLWNAWGYTQANGDTFNAFIASKVLQRFKPELLVVNMQGVDVCHSDFTGYCSNLRKADHAVAQLWNTIQSTPGLANDTILIIAPEHGRNLEPNTLVDAYGRYAYDHTSDNTSREIFCMVVGPPDKVQQNQVITQNEAESIDIVPTIARILGFDIDIPSGLLPGRILEEALVI